MSHSAISRRAASDRQAAPRWRSSRRRSSAAEPTRRFAFAAQTAAGDPCERARRAAGGGAKRAIARLLDAQEPRRLRLRVSGIRLNERRLAGDELVEQRTEREEIGAVVDTLPAELLGRHVVGGAHRHPRVGERRLLRIVGDAEVGDLYLASAAQQHVVGFEVTVHEPARVQLLEAVCDLERDERRDPRWERSHLLERTGRVEPVDVLAGDVGLAAPREAIVDAHHIRVVDRGCGARFAQKALFRLFLAGEIAAHPLEHDAPLELWLDREIHDAHPAFGELALHLVTADPPAGRIGHGAALPYSSITHVSGGFSALFQEQMEDVAADLDTIAVGERARTHEPRRSRGSRWCCRDR